MKKTITETEHITPASDNNVQIGILDTEKIANEVSKVLANTYTLYLKTQKYHWNVQGSNFQELHVLFETQYKDMAEAIDTIAERVRALGFFAPGSFKEFLSLTEIQEKTETLTAEQMLEDLINSHEIIARNIKPIFELLENNTDQVTADLLTHRMNAHEKAAWMLRSSVAH